MAFTSCRLIDIERYFCPIAWGQNIFLLDNAGWGWVYYIKVIYHDYPFSGFVGAFAGRTICWLQVTYLVARRVLPVFIAEHVKPRVFNDTVFHSGWWCFKNSISSSIPQPGASGIKKQPSFS